MAEFREATPAANTHGLELDAIEVTMDGNPVLNGIHLEVSAGEVLALLGPTGSGKTTLLRAACGLTNHRGTVRWQGRDVTSLPPERRGFGLMFQDHALFPHLSVGDNVAFGLRATGTRDRDTTDRTVSRWLERVGLPGFGERRIAGLSGGERQRVALARSLAPEPRIVMLDEPLGSLDKRLRESLANQIGALLREVSQTALYVTHDQEEAFRIADRIAILAGGKVQAIGSAVDLYDAPPTSGVARFLGHDNLLDADWSEADGCFRTPLGPLRYLGHPEHPGPSGPSGHPEHPEHPGHPGHPGPSGQEMKLLVHPDAVSIRNGHSADRHRDQRATPGSVSIGDPATDDPNQMIHWQARVASITYLGPRHRIRLDGDGASLAADIPRGDVPQLGEILELSIDVAAGCRMVAAQPLPTTDIAGD